MAAPRIVIVDGSVGAAEVVVTTRDGTVLAHSSALSPDEARSIAHSPKSARVIDTEQLDAEVLAARAASRLHFAQDITADFEALAEGSSSTPAARRDALGGRGRRHGPHPSCAVAPRRQSSGPGADGMDV